MEKGSWFFFCWIYLTLLPFHFLRVASINSKCVEGEKKKVPNIQNTILSRKHNANLRAHTHTHTPIVYINIREYANYSHSLLTAWMVKELKKCEIRLFQTFFLSTSETICQHRRAWRWSEIKVKVHNYCVFFFFSIFRCRSLSYGLIIVIGYCADSMYLHIGSCDVCAQNTNKWTLNAEPSESNSCRRWKLNSLT